MELITIKGDITSLNVGAVVLPANTQLRRGSGASEAIFQKAGVKELQKACEALAPVEVGSAIPTSGFDLPAEYIIHAVVPKWQGGEQNEYALLSAAYLSSLMIADSLKIESVAFPLLAAGNNGFDPRVAYFVAKNTVENFEPSNNLKKVYLTIYSKTAEALLLTLGEDIAETPAEVLVPVKAGKHHAMAAKGAVAVKGAAAAVAGDVVGVAKKLWDEHKEEIVRIGIRMAFEAGKRALIKGEDKE